MSLFLSGVFGFLPSLQIGIAQRFEKALPLLIPIACVVIDFYAVIISYCFCTFVLISKFFVFTNVPHEEEEIIGYILLVQHVDTACLLVLHDCICRAVLFIWFLGI